MGEGGYGEYEKKKKNNRREDATRMKMNEIKNVNIHKCNAN